MDGHRYPLTYEVKAIPGGATAEEARVAGLGAADAVVLTSIVRADDGGVSHLTLSLDGATGKPLPDDELFKAWALLAHRLVESPTLGLGKKMLCALVDKTVRDAILRARAEEN